MLLKTMQELLFTPVREQVLCTQELQFYHPTAAGWFPPLIRLTRTSFVAVRHSSYMTDLLEFVHQGLACSSICRFSGSFLHLRVLLLSTSQRACPMTASSLGPPCIISKEVTQLPDASNLWRGCAMLISEHMCFCGLGYSANSKRGPHQVCQRKCESDPQLIRLQQH